MNKKFLDSDETLNKRLRKSIHERLMESVDTKPNIMNQLESYHSDTLEATFRKEI